MKLTYKPLNLPLEFTFTISRGSSQEAKTVLVAVEADYNGKTYQGIGEAVPVPFYGEDQQSVCSFYDTLNQDGILSDLDPFNVQAFESRMALYLGHAAAKSGLDIALYDLRGKMLNLPTWKLLGLDANHAPKSSYTIGIADMDTVRLKTETAISRGYDVIKVKLGSDNDLECLKLIKSIADHSIASGATIRVDANAAWTLKQALDILPKLAEMGIEFVEEPLRLDSKEQDYATLYKESPVLLMADESCKTLKDIPRCAQYFGSINLKHTKTGGLSEALRMIHAARAQNLKIMLGCFCESSISISGFAQLSPLVDYADLDGALLVADDPYDGIQFTGSQIILNDRPGIGTVAKSPIASNPK